MKIALIGSNSFLARSIKKYWAENAFFNFSREENKQANWSFFNFPSELPAIEDLAQMDAVIYTAGAGIQSNLPASEEQIFDLNANYPIELIDALASAGYKGSWISFGSYIEYGANHNSLPNESELRQPHSDWGPYLHAKQKLTAHLSQSSLNFIHLIVPNVYGVGENTNRLIPYIVEQLRSNQDIDVSDPNKKRQYLHVSDLILLLKNCISESVYGVINCAPDEHHSIRQVVERAQSFCPQYTGTINFGSHADHDKGIQYLGMGNEKAKNLGWSTQKSLAEGIKEYII